MRSQRTREIAAPLPARFVAPSEPVTDAERWDLTKLFPTPAAWEAEREALALEIKALRKERFSPDIDAQQFLTLLDRTSVLYERLDLLAGAPALSLWLDQDNDEATRRDHRAGSLYDKLSSALAFLDPLVVKIGTERIAEMIRERPELAPHVGYLEHTQKWRAHILPAKIERAVIDATRGADLPSELYDSFSVRLPFRSFSHNGVRYKITQSSYDLLIASPERSVREQVYANYHAPYLQFARTFRDMICSMADQSDGVSKLSKFKSTRDNALIAEDIPHATYEVTAAACKTMQPDFREYFVTRARILGIEKCHEYDLTAPLVSEHSRLTYSRAKEIMYDALAPLGTDYVDTVKRGLEHERWADVYPAPRKVRNAFATLIGPHPFMLLNHGENDGPAQLETFTHETGHLVHFLRSYEAQGYSDRDPTTVPAETAAIVNQFLLRHHMLQTADANQQLAVLDGAFYFLHRYLFQMPCLSVIEDALHTALNDDRTMTTKDLKTLTVATFAEAYGDAVAFDPKEVAVKWATFGHFYDPYYFFQYAVATAAACQIADKLVAGDVKMQAGYAQFLKAGGRIPNKELFELVGLDITSPSLFDPIIARLRGNLEHLKRLVDLPNLRMPPRFDGTPVPPEA